MGAAHQWLETVKIEYNSWMEVEILEDSDALFRVIIESENHMAELIVNEPGFAPYRFVSFLVLGMESPLTSHHCSVFTMMNSVVLRMVYRVDKGK